MTWEDILADIEHPLAFGSFRSWLRLLRDNDGIETTKFLPRILFVSLLSALTSPLRLYERVRYAGALNRTTIHPSPIFIVGHWRTGTTFLHYLMCQDAQVGYVTTFQAAAPGFTLVGERLLKPLLGSIVPKAHPTRLIDNIPLSFDGPQEEDVAVASMTPYSYLHSFTFPRQAASFFERYVLFNDLSEQKRAEWTRVYLTILRKATILAEGKRLVLKSPCNSGRIPVLLELFPEAKFIHIYRDPYDVFMSMRFVYQTVLPRSQLQTVGADLIDAHILRFYEQMMQRYLAERALIPPENLVDVRFEDLEAQPLEQVRGVYADLGLSGFDEAERAFRAYLDSVAGYQKNRYELTDEVIAKVNRHWNFAFEEWGYTRLEASSLLSQGSSPSAGASP